MKFSLTGSSLCPWSGCPATRNGHVTDRVAGFGLFPLSDSALVIAVAALVYSSVWQRVAPCVDKCLNSFPVKWCILLLQLP